MKACRAIFAVTATAAVSSALGFVPITPKTVSTSTTTALAAAEKVEVCGFKDCKRAGGGTRLEKLINTVLEEKGLIGQISVEGCDCQGECGYGPNLVVDGKIVNGVKGKDAVISALKLEE